MSVFIRKTKPNKQNPMLTHWVGFLNTDLPKNNGAGVHISKFENLT